jgi:hypothetical protein
MAKLVQLLRIASEEFTEGLELTDGIVTRASGLLSSLLGASEVKLRAAIKDGRWQATVVSGKYADEIRERLKDAPTIPPSEPFPQPYCFCGRMAHHGVGASILHDRPGLWFCEAHWTDHYLGRPFQELPENVNA